jgi:hypothetical protein
MTPTKSIWFRLGHAYERARQGTPRKSVARLSERVEPSKRHRESDRSIEAAWPSADELIAAGTMLLLDRVLGSRERTRPGIVRLMRAGASGAAAALLVDLLKPLLRGSHEVPVIDRNTADRLLNGLGQGLVYGALVEPRVPGPPLIKGAVYGSVEYAFDPLGGLSTVLGSHTPQGRLPFVGAMLEGLDPHDRAYLEHLVFGIALALLYESSPSSNGIRPDADGDG